MIPVVNDYIDSDELCVGKSLAEVEVLAVSTSFLTDALQVSKYRLRITLPYLYNRIKIVFFCSLINLP